MRYPGLNLVLQMQRMGDLILSFPLFLWLRRHQPDHGIHVVAEEQFFKPLIPVAPPVTYIAWAAADEPLRHKYSTALNLSIRDQAARLVTQVNTDRILGPAIRDDERHVHGEWQLYRASLVQNNKYNRFHWADMNALDAIPLSLIAETRFDLPRTLTNSRKIGLFLGASEAAKRPKPEFWAGLVRELLARDYRPVLFGGPVEQETGRVVETLLGGEKVLNLCGTLGLDEFSKVGQTLSLFITPDTGPMHLAAWTGLKCLNLSMGNVNPWETGPYQSGHYVLRSNTHCARGCWQCSRDRLYCHDAFSPKGVAALAVRMASGASDDRLGRIRLDGLELFRTGRTDTGLYDLIRLGDTTPDEEWLLGAFWREFFGTILGLWSAERCTSAWADFADAFPDETGEFQAALPYIGKEFARALRGATLPDSFWAESDPMLKPFTGYAQMLLENGFYSRATWAENLRLFEALTMASR